MTQALSPQDGVLVVGAGAMGSGIAQVAAQAGHSVVLYDTRAGAAEAAIAQIAQSLDKRVSQGKLAADSAQATLARLRAADELNSLAGIRLAIEAIVEDLKVKQTLFAQLAEQLGPSVILASNTSSLSITALAAGVPHPERVLGLHFFNPAPIMKLVEVVAGLATDPTLLQQVMATAKAWGKTPIAVRSAPGFVVNRVARPFYGEALRVLAERAADEPTLDLLMRDMGQFPMGPFELMDLVGLDIGLAVTESQHAATSGDPRYAPTVLQRERVQAGWLGRKTGRGFYVYGPDGKRIEPTAQAGVANGAQEGLLAEGSASLNVAPAASISASLPAVLQHGDLGPAAPLIERLKACGLTWVHAAAPEQPEHGFLQLGSARIAVTDGRTATLRARQDRHADWVLIDLCLDYGASPRVALARADQCSPESFAQVLALMQRAGFAVSVIDDVAGLILGRTVAMLANEAADLVLQGIASASDVDLAMRLGTAYPIGPLAWCDRLGAAWVVRMLDYLYQHYGDARYRVSPLLRRSAASGASITVPSQA